MSCAAPEVSRAKRDYVKCGQCRSDRKKCMWRSESLEEKCARCTKLGHECGPIVKALRRGGQRANLAGEFLSGFDRRQTHPTPPGFFSHKPAGLSVVLYSLAVNVAAQRVLAKCRRDLETIFELEANLDFNVASFSNENALKLHKRLSQWIKLLQEQQLCGIQETPLHKGIIRMLGAADLMSTMDRKSGDFKVLECSANVWRPSTYISSEKGCNVGAIINELPTEYYESTDLALERVMTCMSEADDGSEEMRQTLSRDFTMAHGRRPFPASHIAFWNMDKEAALKLWKTSTPTMRSTPDILGRSFVQIVQEAGDTEVLKRMVDTLIRDARTSLRDDALLDIAIIGGQASLVQHLLSKHTLPLLNSQELQRGDHRHCFTCTKSHDLLQPTSAAKELDKPNGLADLNGSCDKIGLQADLVAVGCHAQLQYAIAHDPCIFTFGYSGSSTDSSSDHNYLTPSSEYDLALDWNNSGFETPKYSNFYSTSPPEYHFDLPVYNDWIGP